MLQGDLLVCILAPLEVIRRFGTFFLILCGRHGCIYVSGG